MNTELPGFRKSYLVLLLAFFLVGPTSFAAEMKILVSPGVGISNPNIDSEIINALNTTLASTPNLGSYSFIAAVPIPYFSFCSANTNGTLADEVDCAEVDLASARDTWSADIVMLVIDQYGEVQEGMVCGQAPFSGFTISASNHEYGYAAIDYPCQQSFNSVASHEAGHILGLEHEVESDLISFLPLPNNHAHITPNGRGTVMAAGVSDVTDNMYSNTVATIGPFLELAGNSSDADAALVVDYHSWVTVASYREPPPPACVINVGWVCVNNSPQAIVTPTLAGYTMTNIDLEYQLSGSSNWYPIYEGAPTCPIYNPPSTFMNSIVSALVRTASQHVTGCTVNTVPIWCGDGDPL